MKKTLAAVVAVLALVGGLAGCGGRGERAGRNPGTVSQPSSAASHTGGPAAARQPGAPDSRSVDADLDAIEAALHGADADLAAADKTPEDAD